MKHENRGYTILEVMLVVILISILAAIVIPRFTVSTKMAKVQACEMNRSIINKQIETYYFVEATWPLDNLSDIKANNNYFPDGIPTCPVDMTSYEMDPWNGVSPKHRITGHREGAGTHTLR